MENPEFVICNETEFFFSSLNIINMLPMIKVLLSILAYEPLCANLLASMQEFEKNGCIL